MTCKSFCCEKSMSTIVIYIIKPLFIYMFAMTGQTAESNGLNFSEETYGYPWG